MFTTARVLRIGLPLLLVGLASALLVIFTRPHVRYEGIVEDVSAWGAFFGVFGVVYAILAGFLLVTVLTRYTALSQTIEEELNAVESIRDFLIYFDKNQHAPMKEVQNSLARYVKAVATLEWDEMADPKTAMNSDTSDELYEVMQSTGRIDVAKERDNAVLSAVIASVSELAKIRTRRIAFANEQLPPRLRLLLFFMSTALVAAFLALGVRSVGAHAFMTSTLSMSLYLLYWIIEDLDHPFYGVWNIDRSPLDELTKRFESEA